MYFVDVIEPEFGLQHDDWSMTSPRFGEMSQVLVIGWSGRAGWNKKYVVQCSECMKDPELFGEGVFKCVKSSLLLGSVPCGCAQLVGKRTEDQYKILCTRRAEDNGLIFRGFSETFRGLKTKLILYCLEHDTEFKTTSITNFIYRKLSTGCGICRTEKIRSTNRKSDEEMIESFLITSQFVDGTVFTRSPKLNNRGGSPHWFVDCPACGCRGESSASNLQQGKRPCECSINRQKEAYINIISDNGVPLALKFGVANNSNARLQQQSYNSIYEIENHAVFQFESRQKCIEAEIDCKTHLVCGVLSKEEMRDGYTETTFLYNLDKIKQIFMRNGGIQQ